MSTELDTINEDKTNPEVFATSFFGGTDRGRCVQLTQRLRPALPHQVVSLTEEQAGRLVKVLSEWLSDDSLRQVTEAQVREIFQEMMEEKENEPQLHS